MFYNSHDIGFFLPFTGILKLIDAWVIHGHHPSSSLCPKNNVRPRSCPPGVGTDEHGGALRSSRRPGTNRNATTRVSLLGVGMRTWEPFPPPPRFGMRNGTLRGENSSGCTSSQSHRRTRVRGKLGEAWGETASTAGRGPAMTADDGGAGPGPFAPSWVLGCSEYLMNEQMND